jgi:glyoxylase-like metal-dependent hydrolase (beta-lactamase superfamily II)
MKQSLLAALLLIAAATPAAAQVDFSGNWAPLFHEDLPERVAGPEVGDYLGLPINDADRAKAQAWSASLLTLPEHQCMPHPVAYGYRGPANMRIQQDIDRLTQRVVKITIYLQWMQQYREIWMDGRPHPPEYAPHTWQGFSTGTWEGDTLVVTTSHMKAGWVRRNGVIYSDRARFTDRWTRHGDFLTQVAILEDPLNLTEPFVRTTNWLVSPSQQIEPYPCTIVDEVADHKLGQVPHYLPGTNTQLTEFSMRHSINPTWAEGGAQTAYPEFITAMKRGAVTRAAAPPPAAAPAAAASTGIKSIQVQGNVWMLVGAGANVAVQIGNDGVLVVDTGRAPLAEQLLATIKTLADGKTIRFIVNTQDDLDHTGGNEVLTAAGETATGGDVKNALGATSTEGAVVIAHEEVQQRMAQPPGGGQPRPVKAWPTETFFTAEKELFFNGEGIEVLHAPGAHSDADVMVYFRRSDVLVSGDVFSDDTFPVLRRDAGGTINGEVAALNHIIDITIPREKQEGGTYIIPGHGRVVDEADVVDYRDMVTILRDRIQDLVKKGKTLAEVRAAKPTFEYDARWSGPGAASTDAFVESVYRTLGGK